MIIDSAFELWWKRYGKEFAKKLSPTLEPERVACYAFEAGYHIGGKNSGSLEEQDRSIEIVRRYSRDEIESALRFFES